MAEPTPDTKRNTLFWMIVGAVIAAAVIAVLSAPGKRLWDWTWDRLSEQGLTATISAGELYYPPSVLEAADAVQAIPSNLREAEIKAASYARKVSTATNEDVEAFLGGPRMSKALGKLPDRTRETCVSVATEFVTERRPADAAVSLFSKEESAHWQAVASALGPASFPKAYQRAVVANSGKVALKGVTLKIPGAVSARTLKLGVTKLEPEIQGGTIKIGDLAEDGSAEVIVWMNVTPPYHEDEIQVAHEFGVGTVSFLNVKRTASAREETIGSWLKILGVALGVLLIVVVRLVQKKRETGENTKGA